MAEDKPQPLRPFLEAQQEVRRLFDELVRQPWGGKGTPGMAGWEPRCDVVETEQEIVVEVELPGVEREDVRVEVEGDMLRITGERRATIEHRAGQHLRTELQYGRFERRLRLPHTVDRDAIQAQFRSGIVTITLPRKSQQ